VRSFSTLAAGLAASAFVSAVWISSASAATIVNRDDREHRLTVIVEGSADEPHVVAAGASLGDICQKGCVIRLGDSPADAYFVEAQDTVSIERGELYLDNPAGVAPPIGTQGGAERAPLR